MTEARVMAGAGRPIPVMAGAGRPVPVPVPVIAGAGGAVPVMAGAGRPSTTCDATNGYTADHGLRPPMLREAR